MRILLTGGAGFIGSHLAKLLLSKGHTVTLLDNREDWKNAPEKILKCQWIAQDCRDLRTLPNLGWRKEKQWDLFPIGFSRTYDGCPDMTPQKMP